MPLEGLLGMAGQVIRLMALAIAFTGIAISAVAQSDQAVHTATYSA